MTKVRKSVHGPLRALTFRKKFNENILCALPSPSQLKVLKDPKYKSLIRDTTVRFAQQGGRQVEVDTGTEVPEENYRKIHYYVLAHRALPNHMHHGRPHFLGWHRAFLSDFENDLGMALPFWNWVKNKKVPTALSLTNLRKSFDDKSIGTTDAEITANSDFIKHYYDNLLRSKEKLKPETMKTSFKAFAKDIVGGVESKSFDWYDDFAYSWEGSRNSPYKYRFHNRVHGSIGHFVNGGANLGHLAVIKASPLDPVFWLHHCFVDRFWALWHEKYENKDKRSPQKGLSRSDIFYAGYPAGSPPAPYNNLQHSMLKDTESLGKPYKYWGV